MTPRKKLVLDILPLAFFFVAFKFSGLFAATAALVVVTLAVLAVIYYAERTIALAPLITALVVTVFGGLTLWLHDERFIKVKPTIVSLIFACLLLGGCLRGKGFLKYALSAAFNLTERGWFLLSLRWGVFFIFMAALNEVVWRNFSLADWVNFKVFGLMGLTMAFALSQMGFIARHSLPDPAE